VLSGFSTMMVELCVSFLLNVNVGVSDDPAP